MGFVSKPLCTTACVLNIGSPCMFVRPGVRVHMVATYHIIHILKLYIKLTNCQIKYVLASYLVRVTSITIWEASSKFGIFVLVLLY